MAEKKEKHPDTMRVEIVYAGGTISSMVTAGGYREGGHKLDLVQLLIERSPGSLKNVQLTGSDFAYTGLSENIDHDHWNNIIAKVEDSLKRSPKTIILTHGTDSMEQTARHLQNVLGEKLLQSNTSVLITGANQDTSHPQTDAWENLEFAFHAGNMVKKTGVYIAFHGLLIPAENAVKEPFNGITMHYADKTSDSYQSRLSEQKQRDNELRKKLQQIYPLSPLPKSILDYPVNNVAQKHETLWKQLNANPNISAVLLTLYHSGTANTVHPDYNVIPVVEELRRQGIVVFGVTENDEPTSLNLYETSVALREAGVIPLFDMTKAVALEKLSYVAHLPTEHLIEAMLANQIGEINDAPDQSELNELITRYML